MVPAACAQLCASFPLSPQLSSRGLTQPFPGCLTQKGHCRRLTTPGEFHRPGVVPASAHGKSCPALPAWPRILRDHEPDALARPGEALGPRIIMTVGVLGALTRPQPASPSHVSAPSTPGSSAWLLHSAIPEAPPTAPSSWSFCWAIPSASKALHHQASQVSPKNQN